MKMTRIALLTLGMALAAGRASAQEFQFGAHGGLNLPIGDLDDAVDGRPGFTLGGHVGIYFGNGHEVRPRVDFTHYDGGWTPVDGGGKATVSAWGLGADYLYYLDARPQGIYLTAGLGLQNWDVNPDHGPSRDETALSMAAGAGFRFNRTFALECRFTTGKFQSSDGQATALQLLGTMRF